jgi:hypothetical protein
MSDYIFVILNIVPKVYHPSVVILYFRPIRIDQPLNFRQMQRRFLLIMFMVTIIVSQSFYDVNWGFSTGLNENGVLGLGNQLDTNIPTRIPKMINISRVSVDKHALILLQNGSVFSHGAGQPEGGVSPGTGQLGHGDQNPMELSPRLIQGLVGIEIVQVSAGCSHSIVLSSQNEIYSFGTNNV